MTEGVRSGRELRGDLELDCGIGRLHLGQSRNARILGIVETRPRAAHDEIRFPGEVVGGKAEFVERACIDEMNGDAEADAEADCCERQKRPPGLRAQGTRYEGTEERRCERQPGH